MSNNFKVGDQVRVLATDNKALLGFIGKVGTITKGDGSDYMPFKVTIEGVEWCWFRPEEIEHVTPAKREPKVGDKVRILGIRHTLHGTQFTSDRKVGQIATIEAIPGRVFPIRVRLTDDTTAGLQEGDYELLPDYADDPKIQQYERAIETAKQQIAYAEGLIVARKAELDELAKPKVTLSEVERKFLNKHKDCGDALAFAKDYDSLENAYEACKDEYLRVRAWMAILNCETKLAERFCETDINPFQLRNFKDQLKALEAGASK